MKEPLKDRGALDLTFLIEEHQRQIWEYKQKESEWIKTEVQALGPWSSNTFPISMYRGSRIRELVTSGLKLDACYSGLDACRLALEELGA
jgi:hypothetical protein